MDSQQFTDNLKSHFKNLFNPDDDCVRKYDIEELDITSFRIYKRRSTINYKLLVRQTYLDIPHNYYNVIIEIYNTTELICTYQGVLHCKGLSDIDFSCKLVLDTFEVLSSLEVAPNLKFKTNGKSI